MFPQMRVGNIFRNMTPRQYGEPDFGEGEMDIEPIISRIIEMRQNQDVQDKNDRANAEARQSMEQNRLKTIADAAAMRTKPMNVVAGPGALSQARIGIDPDKGDIFGMDPKMAALGLKQQQFEDTLDFKRDQLDSTSDYRNRALEQKGQLGEEANKIRANRADIYRYKAMHPDHKFMISRGGNIFAFNPDTGDAFDTGVDSGTLSEEDKLELLGQQRANEIGMRGTNAATLEGIRQSGRLGEIAARTAGQKEINAAKPERGELPTQTRVRQNLTAHQFLNQYPEYSRWVTFNGDGTFSISKNTPADIKTKINSVLYPNQTPAAQPKKEESKKEEPKKKDSLGIRGGV